MRFQHAGCQIAYDDTGSGTPVLVLHGLTQDRALVKHAADATLASAGARRIYVDLPGHGESVPASFALAAADDLADALAALLDQLGLPRVHIAAHAYGAYLALGLLARRRVHGMFLSCPVVQPELRMRKLPAPAQIAADASLVFAGEEEEIAFDEIAVARTPAALADFRALVFPANRAVDRTFLAALRQRYALSSIFSDAIDSLDAPSAIVCGARDHWNGCEEAMRLAAALPRCTFTIVPDTGPLLPIEAGESYRERLLAWAGQIGR